MLRAVISGALLTVCGAGLLVSWMPDRTAWQIFELLVYALTVIWFVGWAVGRIGGVSWTWLVVPFLPIVAWGCAQLGWTVYGFATLTDILRWVAYAGVFFLAFETCGQRGFCRLLTIYGCVLTVVCIFQFFLGNGKIFWLFTPGEAPSGLGPFLNRDHFASFVALVLPAAAVEMVRHHRQRWVFALATAVLYAGVIAGASRAGFVLLTLEVILLFLVLGFSGRVVAATIALMIVFVFVVGWENLYSRLQAPDPYAGRREVAQASIQMIRANPWKGTGLGTWTLVYPAYAPKDFGVFVNAAHNDWLQWAVEGGLPLAVIMLVLFCGSLVVVRRVPWAMGVPIVLLHSLIDFPMQGKFLPAAVFLVFGAGARAAQDRSAR